MKLKNIIEIVTDNAKFQTLDEYLDFCRRYLEFIGNDQNLQARIVAQNENQYIFCQYRKEGGYQITRPINSLMFYDLGSFEVNLNLFKLIASDSNDIEPDLDARRCVNNMLYTIQQSIGSALDGLPAGKSNTARKINGTLFEKLIVLFFASRGFMASAESIDIPVVHNNQVLFKMKYQHDLILRNECGDVRVIGAIKTTSKDRIDKVFIDRLLYSRLTSSDIKHIAIILNDVQRKKTKNANQFSVGSTFLPGRFKGYMIKLCPLDGVYYLDIRKNMETDPELKHMIKPFDQLVFEDMMHFTGKA